MESLRWRLDVAISNRSVCKEILHKLCYIYYLCNIYNIILEYGNSVPVFLVSDADCLSSQLVLFTYLVVI